KKEEAGRAEADESGPSRGGSKETGHRGRGADEGSRAEDDRSRRPAERGGPAENRDDDGEEREVTQNPGPIDAGESSDPKEEKHARPHRGGVEHLDFFF